MPHAIGWCGFFGAWLLVAGPLDQAVREVEDNEFGHEAYEWPEWVFGALVMAMLLFCVGTTRRRHHHRQARPAVDD